MMVIWEKKEINEKELGQTLFLKSNTLASLLKKLKAKGYIDINKNMKDSRNIVITLTELGKNLKEKAVTVPYSIVKTINLSEEEALYLYKILYKILEVEKKMSYDVIYIGSGHACWHGALILKTLGIKEPSKMIFAFPTQTYGLISSLIPLFLKKKLVII